jgi:site-specific DNA-methyltransferase (adenine-specific)
MISQAVYEDCYKILPTLQNESIDLIIIDPPYEINYNNEKWDRNPLDWGFLFYHFKRILSSNGNLVIFQGWSNVSRTLDISKTYFVLRNWVIWDRIKGRGAKYNLVSTREDILWFAHHDRSVFHPSKSTIKKKTGGMGLKNGSEYRSLSNIWTDIPPIVPWSKERVDHPTQKPVELIKRIVTVFSNERDNILDCFAGSGTTGVACSTLNRNFLLVEKDEVYFKILTDRINA